MSSGYRLEDGSWSSEYKAGDTFITTEDSIAKAGAIVSLIYDDESDCPEFKYISGNGYTEEWDSDTYATFFCSWEILKHYVENKEYCLEKLQRQRDLAKKVLDELDAKIKELGGEL